MNPDNPTKGFRQHIWEVTSALCTHQQRPRIMCNDAVAFHLKIRRPRAFLSLTKRIPRRAVRPRSAVVGAGAHEMLFVHPHP